MMSPMRVFATCLMIAALHGSAQAQQPKPPAPTPGVPRPEAALPGSARDITNTITAVPSCRLVPTPQLLGYDSNGKPVYQNACTGFCLSVRLRPTVCSATSKRITVSSSGYGYYNPFEYNTVVSQVYQCQCKPAPCTVVVGGVTTTYQHGATAFDVCNRRCLCSYGVLTNCCRQRKEFRLGMTVAEKQRFINAMLTLSNPMSPLNAQFNTLIRKHQILFGSGIHSGPLFFPWHREYIFDLENLLQQVDCRVTVPYWRWSMEAANPFASSIWAGTPSGFGGNGVPGGSCIASGPFQPPWVDSQFTPQCLRRNWFNAATFATESAITTLLDVTCPTSADYNCMRSGIESFHNQVHVSIGGQMGGASSTNDPIFFLHHTYIDRLWARWQGKGAAYVTAYNANPNILMPGSSTTPADWFDLGAQQGNPANRVCYIDPPTLWWVDTVLAPVSLARNSFFGGTGRPDNGSVSACRTCTSSYDDCGDSPSYGYGSADNYYPVNEPCQTPESVKQIPRVPLYPFWDSWLRAMNMTEREIAEDRQFFNQQNDNRVNRIISQQDALTSNGATPYTGMYLYDSDYACLEKARPVVKGCAEPELPYPQYDREPPVYYQDQNSAPPPKTSDAILAPAGDTRAELDRNNLP